MALARAPLSSLSLSRRRNIHVVCGALPLTDSGNQYARELKAAVDVVHKACTLCVHVKRQLSSKVNGILEKKDSTPVTIADFGVQALISMELAKLFPSIPLVAEEDSKQLTSDIKNEGIEGSSNSLVEMIKEAVSHANNVSVDQLADTDILRAIDRGKATQSLEDYKALYWVLDPIDGTRGFLQGGKALYVVGLALVADGKPILGVMGCPNWDIEEMPAGNGAPNNFGSGIIMAALVGCGTWTRKLSLNKWSLQGVNECWNRCFVDNCGSTLEACYCIQDRQAWELLPISNKLGATTSHNKNVESWKPHIIPTCCGSLCKYMMIASGKASVFFVQVARGATVKIWDHASGMICVSEAGGKVFTEFDVFSAFWQNFGKFSANFEQLFSKFRCAKVSSWDGSSLMLASKAVESQMVSPHGGGILVTNGLLHNKILDIV